MKELKIGYFADGPWSHKAFEKIIADPTIKIMFIVPRNDTKDMQLKNYAEQYNIDYITGAKVNSDEFIEKVSAYGCDLFVSMSYNQIFRNRIINVPPMKTINCHAGKLPFYRGRNILNWVLINDEKEFGITVHYVDEGIDTGDIILQRTYPVTDEDTYHSLLMDAHEDCAVVLYDALKMLQDGTATRQKQDEIHPVGFYCGERTVGDEIVDWNQSSRKVFNFIRSIYCPGDILATSYVNGKEVLVKRAAMVKDAPEYIGIPGQVVGKTDRGVLIKTADTMLELYDYEYERKLRVGDRLKGK